MKTLMMFIFFMICDISTLFTAVITPYITRKTESFGVGIPEEVHSSTEVKRIRTDYRNRILLIGGLLSLIVLIVILISPTDISFLLITGMTFVNLIVMFTFYMTGNRQMKELKEKENWLSGKTQMTVVDTGFRNKKIIASPLWFGLYAVIIIVTAVMGFALYDKLPERIPMHWNIEGTVDSWADKSYKIILWAPFVQLFLTFIMGASYWMIGKSKQVVDPSKPEISAEQNRKFRYRWSVYLIVTGLSLLVMIGFIQFFSFGFIKSSWILMAVIMTFSISIVVAAIALSIKTGQGGSKLYIKEVKTGDKLESKIISRDEDEFWKLGLIYYNPDDSSFIVERRFGVGWTINFGRPAAWIIVIGFTLSIAAFTVISIVLSK